MLSEKLAAQVRITFALFSVVVMLSNIDRRNYMLRRFVSVIAVLVSLILPSWAFAAVEINTADQAQLDSIAGIGPATSRAILEERKKNGNFKDWADLEQRVRGIGERNSVKLSAAGLVVNGQQRNAQAAAEKTAHPVRMSKGMKEHKADTKADHKADHKADKDVQSTDGDSKGGDARR